jgi:L-fuculose-phosphate aldolase
MQERALREQVAWACRILALYGQGDLTLGHVSARRPGGDSYYMKAKGLGLDEVRPEGLVGLDLNGKRVWGDGELHLEAPLHTAVYRLRPDVGAVVHTHPPFATALGATRAGLEFVNHDALLFPEGVATFEEIPELITMPLQGEAVARALGSRRAVLMRNHGVLVVGQDVPWAVYAALTLERAVQIQLIATGLGPLSPIPLELVPRLHQEKYRNEFVGQYWEYLVRKVRRQGLAEGMPAPASVD